MFNKDLPIWPFKENIQETVADNPVTIITAETGSGKSTQVPQFLEELGCRCLITQPRRLTARTISKRVAEEMAVELGGKVGYRTAYERFDSYETDHLFVTDGLAMVRELMGHNHFDVLIIDEVHEWNLNIEVLVAWVRQKLLQGLELKVVLMSATLESGKLSAYFDNAPVIDVPGRLYPISELKPGANMLDDAVKLLKMGRNVYVFQPGKADVYEFINDLERLVGSNAVILPLHGELKVEEQDYCYIDYGKPKCIVCTNIAETGVTIPGMNAVIDSGMEKRKEVVNGIEGLYLRPISIASRIQRKARGARTSDGIYIDHHPIPLHKRDQFSTAEIQRVRLDQVVLRLAQIGIKAEEVEFFHQPDKSEIKQARQELVTLGCMEKDGQVTKIGHLVAKLPISVMFGRMIVEADRLGVVDDIIDIAAILEQGGITIIRNRDGVLGKLLWHKLCPEEKESDLLAQLAIFLKARQMSKDQMIKHGIMIKAYFQTLERRRFLAESLRGKVRSFKSSGNRQSIIKAIVSGMLNHVYRKSFDRWVNGDSEPRLLSDASVIEQRTQFAVGIPFDVQYKDKRFGFLKTLSLLTMATSVTPDILAEVAPHLIEIEVSPQATYNLTLDVCENLVKIFFNGKLLVEKVLTDTDQERCSLAFASWIAKQIHQFMSESVFEDSPEYIKKILGLVYKNREIIKKARQLNLLAGAELFPVMEIKELVTWLQDHLKGATCVNEIEDFEALILPALDKELRSLVVEENPEEIELQGYRLLIEYVKNNHSGELYCFTVVPVELIRAAKVDNIVLPSGREVELQCYSSKSMTFSELARKVGLFDDKARARREARRNPWLMPKAEFIETGGRHFKCQCGNQVRLTKGYYNRYQEGDEIEIVCNLCGCRGKLLKEKACEASDVSEPNKPLDLSGLQAAFNGK